MGEFSSAWVEIDVWEMTDEDKTVADTTKVTGRAVVDGVEQDAVATTTAVIVVVWDETTGRRVIQSEDPVFVVESSIGHAYTHNVGPALVAQKPLCSAPMSLVVYVSSPSTLILFC